MGLALSFTAYAECKLYRHLTVAELVDFLLHIQVVNTKSRSDPFDTTFLFTAYASCKRHHPRSSA